MKTVSKRSLIMFFFDVVGFYLSFAVLYYARFDAWLNDGYSVLFLLSIPVFGLLYIFNIFNLERKTSVISLFANTIVAVVLGGVFSSSFIYLFQITIHTEPLLQRTILSGALLLFSVWASINHSLSYILKRNLREKARWIVIGAGKKATLLHDDLKSFGWDDLLHFLSTENDISLDNIGVNEKTIASVDALGKLNLLEYKGVILALDSTLSDDQLKILMRARLRGIVVYELADFYETCLLRVPVIHLKDGWITFSSGFDLIHHGIQLNVKRLFDVVVAALLVLFTLPFWILIAIVIYLGDRGKVFFVQERTGLNGKSFRLYKFRTMVVDADKIGAAVTYKNDPRITRVGRFIRKSRLDELPQLINVLKGDMSFIGPRPESIGLTEKYQKIIPYYDIRAMVKPGVTGWAQIMYPATDSIEGAQKKLEYDIYYIKNYSLVLDFYILLRTLRVVLNCSGN